MSAVRLHYREKSCVQVFRAATCAQACLLMKCDNEPERWIQSTTLGDYNNDPPTAVCLSLVRRHSLEGVCPIRRDATACGCLLILVEDGAGFQLTGLFQGGHVWIWLLHGQTDRLADRRADRRADRQAHKQMDRQTGKKKQRSINRHPDRWVDRHIDK